MMSFDEGFWNEDLEVTYTSQNVQDIFIWKLGLWADVCPIFQGASEEQDGCKFKALHPLIQDNTTC